MTKHIQQLRKDFETALRRYEIAHQQWMTTSIYSQNHQFVLRELNETRADFINARVSYEAAQQRRIKV